jgi:4-hydroxybenzoyl-CoA thioesterase
MIATDVARGADVEVGTPRRGGAMEGFRYRRRVGFGECDPARIFFAPRAFDYAVEAVEAWFGAALGIPLAALSSREGLDAKVIALDCGYERPLVEGDEIDVLVGVSAVAEDAFTLAADGVLPGGARSFRAEVTLALVARGEDRRVALAPGRRARLEALVAAREAARANVDAGPALLARVPPAAPFTRIRRVHHGDCTVSGDVYAPRVAEWAAEAVGEWYAETLGISWTEQCRRGRGTPFLAIRCELTRRVEPGDALTLAVTIPRLGSSSIGYAVAGTDARGERCFAAELAACHITEEGGRRSAPFPEPLRARILAYQAASGAATSRP